jgi:hypothetical protein
MLAEERTLAAKTAAQILKISTPAELSHPYAKRKSLPVLPNVYEVSLTDVIDVAGYTPRSGGDALEGRLLVIPVYQENQLSTLELIDERGRKTALKGRGSKSGGFWVTEDLPTDSESAVTLLIGEGVATVITAANSTGHIGIAALSSGNLCNVSAQLRKRYKKADIVVLADLEKKSGDPDAHALEAARKVSGRIAIPDFGSSRDQSQTDFNDLSAVIGPEALRQIINDADILTATYDDSRNFLIRLPGDFSPNLDDHALVQGLLPEKALAAMIGVPNTGKSALAIDLSVAVATGRPFRGLRVRQCGVLYVATEGAHGLNNRIAALLQTERLSLDAPFGVVTESVDLCSSPSDSSRIIVACAALRRQTSQPVGLVVIDTLARAMNGGDENSGGDMGRLLRNAENIQKQVGATVLLIHHAGKDTSKGARGHSSFRAALDTEVTVEGPTNPRTVSVTKQRDLAPLESFGFNLIPVTVGMNTHGEPVTAVIVEHSNTSISKRVSGRGKNQTAALAALREYASTSTDPLITTHALTELLNRQSISKRQRRREITQWLLNEGFLTQASNGYTIDRSTLWPYETSEK